MTKQFDGIVKQTPMPVYSRATLFDPRFKKVAFGIEENANDKNIHFFLKLLLRILQLNY